MLFRVTSEARGEIWTGADRAEAERVAITAAVNTGRTTYLSPWHGCIEHNRNHCTACRTCDCH